ncbi:hypothetical protein HVPorG_02965 [Roseomonas mucosa]|uniref:5-bromo-4-chloroindolyl phosphate hydrolysis protein n=2 Tax=Roseomonas TaxID=125216 RepID=A0A1S8D8N4_9PROT|nr:MULTISPECIES: hypothetical protein [Roseomonas]MBS5901119.1 hypothetical protein [Acetobacteraceae bacterium]ATR20479.1 hypothetical protein CTJ15_09285 [Roseomonas sp. FDAARGOS_362]AWV23222.1 hypothetical protein RADP37_02965 [Roseomonas mucosa]MCG7351148.1 hypothetical protein [Roseomonas mucosa]MCG7355445.1 hypothetical protein [Roseomonas mucosa]
MLPETYRKALRGLALPVMALPMLPALLLALASGQSRTILGLLAGLAGTGLTVALLRRAKHGDRRRAMAALGLGTGFAAALAGGTGTVGAVLLGLAAAYGLRLAYEGLREEKPEPYQGDAGLEPFARRLAVLEGTDTRLAGAVLALRGLLREMALRPSMAGQARSLLVLGLDGLERIAQRLSAGAVAPRELTAAMSDVERAASQAAERLRASETEALDVQVTVLRQRLREEGVA